MAATAATSVAIAAFGFPIAGAAAMFAPSKISHHGRHGLFSGLTAEGILSTLGRLHVSVEFGPLGLCERMCRYFRGLDRKAHGANWTSRIVGVNYFRRLVQGTRDDRDETIEDLSVKTPLAAFREGFERSSGIFLKVYGHHLSPFRPGWARSIIF
jgi:hypothetical protein